MRINSAPAAFTLPGYITTDAVSVHICGLRIMAMKSILNDFYIRAVVWLVHDKKDI